MKVILVFLRSFMIGFTAVALLIMLISSLLTGRELDVSLLVIQLGALIMWIEEEKKEKVGV